MNIKHFIKELMPYIVIVIVVVLIRSFIITPGFVKGSSMETTLFNNDLVLINKIKLRFGINRYDIISLNYGNDTLVKRVIGLPSETIEYKQNKLYINGEEVTPPINFEYTSSFKLTAGDNEYIVLGDNRDVSKDSRSFGCINKDEINGVIDFILFPFSRFGKIE